ncbi:MAG: N-acetylmuramoyl-L-alanine amidase [FCB group bacterium]|nr:N-acetylmuramoyl-L-alanine amidase [FCB group bacterium]
MKYWPTLILTLLPLRLPAQIQGDMTTYRSIERIYSQQSAERDTSRLMIMTFPADSDTFYVDRVRFGAFIRDTTATVKLDTQNIPVYPSGAVTDQFYLEPGWNSYTFIIDGKKGRDSLSFRLFRREAVPQLPATPTIISEDGQSPETDRFYYTPEVITVRMVASPGGKAQFKIPHLTSGYLPMQELPRENTGGKTGVYEGTYRIQPGDRCQRQKVKFYLKGMDGRSRKMKSPGRITVFDRRQPLVLETVEDNTLIYYSPNGEIMTELQAGFLLEGLSRTGRWWKVRLSPQQEGYVSRNSVNQVPDGRAIPKYLAYGITTEVDSDWVHLEFHLSGKAIYRLSQNDDPQSVTIRFFNTRFQDEWSRYPESDSLIQNYFWQQNGSDMDFTVILNSDQQWGFKGRYEGNLFRLSLRKPPIISRDRPFENLIIALDAGHGGKHKGALGSTGLMEKDVNLVYTKFLAAMLDSAGARVILTRDRDTTMFLRPRAEIAAENRAHIMVWMHNNSTGWTRHPDEAVGTSTYYTHLQGWPFARATYPHLLDLGLEPEGRVHRAYFMTRQTDFVVFLVEGAFLSNPRDEMWLMKDAHLKLLARAVLLGLNDRLMELAK